MRNQDLADFKGQSIDYRLLFKQCLLFGTLSAQELYQKCLDKAEFAMHVINTPDLLNKLGRYDGQKMLSLREKTPVINLEANFQISGIYLVNIAHRHIEFRNLLLASFSELISDSDKASLKASKVTNTYSYALGGCAR